MTIPPYDWDHNYTPMSHVVPFTYKDGMTFLELLKSFQQYINHGLIGHVDGKLDELNDILEGEFQKYEDVSIAWNTRWDDFMANINAEIKQLNDAALAELVNEAGSQVQNALDTWLDGVIAGVVDPVNADLIGDTSSQTRAALDTWFSDQDAVLNRGGVSTSEDLNSVTESGHYFTYGAGASAVNNYPAGGDTNPGIVVVYRAADNASFLMQYYTERTYGGVPGRRWHREAILSGGAPSTWYEWVPEFRTASTPQHFGAEGDGSTDDTAAVQSWLDSGDVLTVDGGTFRVTSELTVPAGVSITGRLAFEVDQSIEAFLTFGTGVTMDEIYVHVSQDSGSGTPRVFADSGFTIESFTMVSDVELVGGCFRLNNTDAAIGDMRFHNVTRPVIIGLGEATATVGGHVRSITADVFTRGLAGQHAHGWTVGRIVTRGTAATAQKNPGHNTVLISDCSDWYIGEIYAEGTGEHVFRIGGSTMGGQSHGWRIGSIVAKNIGGCAFKLYDHIQYVENWSVGSITLYGARPEANSNSELMRITRSRNGMVGRAEAFHVGELFSCSGGLHMADVKDLHVGVMGIRENAQSAVRIADQDSTDTFITARITIGVLNNITTSDTGMIALGGVDTTINGLVIGGGYFDVPGEILTAYSGVTVDTPISLDGTVAGASSGVFTGVSDEFMSLGLRSVSGMVIAGNAGGAESDYNGSLSIGTVGGGTVDGTSGAGVVFSRPATLNRNGAFLTPYNDGGGSAEQVGLKMGAGSNVTSTDIVRDQWRFRYSGDVQLNTPGAGVVVTSPDGSQWRIRVGDDGTLYAETA